MPSFPLSEWPLTCSKVHVPQTMSSLGNYGDTHVNTPKTLSTFLLSASISLSTALFANGPSGVKLTGTIDTLPSSGRNGTWVVDGRNVIVTSETGIETKSGPVTAGACVDVSGTAAAGTAIDAKKITTRPASKCKDASTGKDGVEIFGAIELLPPAGARIGDWKVAGTFVRVTAQTKIEQEAAPVVLGACAEVQGTRNPDNSLTASKIEITAGIAGCRESNNNSPNEELEFRGTVQTAPPSGSQLWIISGRRVTVSSSTQLSPPGRPLAAGNCVEVKGELESDNSITAARIQTLGNGVCNNGLDRQADVSFFGTITTLPAGGLIGNWNVNGLTVTVTATTRVVTGDGAIAVGRCVQVKGDFAANNTLNARQIEGRPAGACAPATGAYRFEGPIEAIPPGALAGTWKVGGRDVIADNATVVDSTSGAVILGACAAVSGAIQPAGAIRASRIEIITSSGACIFSGGIVGGGNLTGTGVSAGEIVSIFGQQIGPATGLPLEIINGQVSNRLANTRVLFDGTPATLLFVSNSQINAIVPCNVGGKPTVQVQVESNGAWTNAVVLPVLATNPSLFTQSGSGTGPGAILNFVAPTGYTLNTAANATARGGTAILFGTGQGQTTPACQDGAIASLTPPFPVPVAPVSVEIGGKPAIVTYAGGAPGLVRGLIQVNVTLPLDAPVGPAIPIVMKIGTAASQAGVTMAVK